MIAVLCIVGILGAAAGVIYRLRPIGSGPGTARRRLDRRVCGALFSGALLLYALTLPGITTTLDEDLAALTRSLSRAGTLVIDDYSRGYHDASRHDGHFYAHKNPATSVLAIPFYLAGGTLGLRRDNDAVLVNGNRFRLRPECRPQRVVITHELQPIGKMRVTINDTAAKPENLTLTGIHWLDSPPGGCKIADASGAPVNLPTDGAEWARRGSRLAWPAKPGGIELPLVLDIQCILKISRGVMFEYSGLFPEMTATEWTIDGFLTNNAVPLSKENVSVQCWSWVEGQRRVMGMGSAICAALTVVLVYLTARRMDARAAPAALGAMLVMAASLHWRYAGTLYNHSLLTLAVTGLLHATMAGRQEPVNRPRWAFVAGLWGGLGMLADAIFALPLTVCLLGWAQTMMSRSGSRWLILRNIAPPIAAAGILLGLYQNACFGSPWHTPNQFSFDHEWLRSFSTAFDGSLWRGMWMLLYGVGRDAATDAPARFVVDPGDYRGLFVAEPVTVLAIIGLALCSQRWRFEAALLAATFLSTFILMAKFRTPWGGGDEDTRYLVHVTPALYVGVCLWWDHIWTRTGGKLAASRNAAPRPAAMHGLLWSVGILTAFFGLRQTWEHLGEGLGRWDHTWRTGISILPAIPKPTGFEALWLAAPIAGLLLLHVWRTTRETGE